MKYIIFLIILIFYTCNLHYANENIIYSIEKECNIDQTLVNDTCVNNILTKKCVNLPENAHWVTNDYVFGVLEKNDNNEYIYNYHENIAKYFELYKNERSCTFLCNENYEFKNNQCIENRKIKKCPQLNTGSVYWLGYYYEYKKGETWLDEVDNKNVIYSQNNDGNVCSYHCDNNAIWNGKECKINEHQWVFQESGVCINNQQVYQYVCKSKEGTIVLDELCNNTKPEPFKDKCKENTIKDKKGYIPPPLPNEVLDNIEVYPQSNFSDSNIPETPITMNNIHQNIVPKKEQKDKEFFDSKNWQFNDDPRKQNCIYNHKTYCRTLRGDSDYTYLIEFYFNGEKICTNKPGKICMHEDKKFKCEDPEICIVE